jgi:hypothetical protein
MKAKPPTSAAMMINNKNSNGSVSGIGHRITRSYLPKSYQTLLQLAKRNTHYGTPARRVGAEAQAVKYWHAVVAADHELAIEQA